MGYCESFEEYKNWLNKSDILPVTSNQDFFGISIVEAVYCNVIPLLPNRLSYPEIFQYKNNMHLFYKEDKELLDVLIKTITNINNLGKEINSLSDYVYREYNWEIISKKYDQKFALFFN